MSILSVNRNSSMNLLIQTVLAKKYKLVPVTDVFEGMYHLKTAKDRIQLIIVDVDHQSQEAWDFIHHIKTSQVLQKPVLVLSSDNSKATVDMLSQLQVDHFFFKPFNPLEVMKVVNRLMKLSTMNVPTIF